LIHAGFDVTQSSDGADAWRLIESREFEAILSDVSMPEIDGLTLLRRVRKSSLDIPVILMLDKPDNRTAIDGTRLGAVQTLVKPIAPKLLAESASYAVHLGRARRHSPVAPRQHRPGATEASAISATAAKNEFGRILEKVIQGGTVVIMKHDSPKAVLISMEEYDALSNAHRVEIATLSDEFDKLLVRMQTPAAGAGMKAAFNATPKELGQAALAAARKRV
jgi:prevent-host-death family protein